MIIGKVKRGSDSKGSGLRLLIAGVLVAVLSSLLLFGASACSSGGESPETAGGPRIQFQQEAIDLGTASPGDELHAEFYFRNAGDDTLVIGEITTEVATEGC
jgi:hypothetical protein